MSDKNGNKNLWITILVIGVILIFGKIIISNFWGHKDPDSFFEASRPYSADSRYFIYLFPEIKDSKNFRVPADIIIEDDCDGDGCETAVRLDIAYLDDSELYFDCRIYYNDETWCKDENGKEWMIVFHGEKFITGEDLQKSKERIEKVVESVM